MAGPAAAQAQDERGTRQPAAGDASAAREAREQLASSTTPSGTEVRGRLPGAVVHVRGADRHERPHACGVRASCRWNSSRRSKPNLNEKKYQEAYDLAKNDDSFLGHVLAAGLAKLSQGYPQAIEAMQEVGEEETMKLEHRPRLYRLDRHHQPDGRAAGHGRRDGAVIPGHRAEPHTAQAVGVGPGYLDGLDHHLGRPLVGHSGHRLVRHHAKPHGPPDARSGHRQRRLMSKLP